MTTPKTEVLIVGIDGLGGVFLDCALRENRRSADQSKPLAFNIPNLTFCHAAGGSLDCRCVYPAISAPVWASVLTGLAPDQSGICDNSWTPTVEVEAQQQASEHVVGGVPQNGSSVVFGSNGHDVLMPIGGRFSFDAAAETSNPKDGAALASTETAKRVILRRPRNVFTHLLRTLRKDVVCAAITNWSVWFFPFFGYNTQVVAKSPLASMIAAESPTTTEPKQRQLETLHAVDAPDECKLHVGNGSDGEVVEQAVSVLRTWDATNHNDNNSRTSQVREGQPEQTPSAASVTNLCLFVHLDDVDHAGHEHGWGSPEYLREMENADARLGQLIKAFGVEAKSERSFPNPADVLVARKLLIVLSDHGGKGTNHGDLDRANQHSFLTAFVAEVYDDAASPTAVAAAAAADGQSTTPTSSPEGATSRYWVRRPKLFAFEQADRLRQLQQEAGAAETKSTNTLADFDDVGTFISCLDVTPTVLDFFGVEATPKVLSMSMRGNSLFGPPS